MLPPKQPLRSSSTVLAPARAAASAAARPPGPLPTTSTSVSTITSTARAGSRMEVIGSSSRAVGALGDPAQQRPVVLEAWRDMAGDLPGVIPAPQLHRVGGETALLKPAALRRRKSAALEFKTEPGSVAQRGFIGRLGRAEVALGRHVQHHRA